MFFAYLVGGSVLNRNPPHTAATSRTSMHSKNRKGTEKNRVPFVISFSDDDDSGSDSEEFRNGNIESDEVARGVTDNRKLSTSLANSQMVQQTAKTSIKMPKKLSMGRTVSSMNRYNGTSAKNGGSTSVGVKTHHKKSNPPNKIKFAPNVHINSNKLQDLRQLIAIRENELKSKSGQLNKEVASSALKNSTNMNFKISAVRSRDSAEGVVVEPKEPEKKRLKVVEPSTSALISVGKHDRLPSESTFGAKSAIEIDSLKYDGRHREILGGTGQHSAMQQIKEVKNPNIPSTHLPSGWKVIRLKIILLVIYLQ